MDLRWGRAWGVGETMASKSQCGWGKCRKRQVVGMMFGRWARAGGEGFILSDKLLEDPSQVEIALLMVSYLMCFLSAVICDPQYYYG